jgi:hypothetical protein
VRRKAVFVLFNIGFETLNSHGLHRGPVDHLVSLVEYDSLLSRVTYLFVTLALETHRAKETTTFMVNGAYEGSNGWATNNGTTSRMCDLWKCCQSYAIQVGCGNQTYISTKDHHGPLWRLELECSADASITIFAVRDSVVSARQLEINLYHDIGYVLTEGVIIC